MKCPLTATVLALQILLLVACNSPVEHPASKTDPYEVKLMDFKPTPASISSERHTGPFMSGNSLRVCSQSIEPCYAI